MLHYISYYKLYGIILYHMLKKNKLYIYNIILYYIIYIMILFFDIIYI